MDLRKRVLVVDDEVNVRFVMHDALARLGGEYEVVTAQNGHEAMEKITAMPFDLILTDLRMPDMDGVELTEAIRASHPNAVVIWMTAYGCHHVRAQAARLRVYDCLDKPVELPEILRIAREALAGSEGRDPTKH
jgi:two-component system response regulator HydG